METSVQVCISDCKKNVPCSRDGIYLVYGHPTITRVFLEWVLKKTID